MAGQQFSLSIRLPRRELEWLSAQLVELGYPAFEERAAPGGLEVVIYGTDERQLSAVRAALGERARARSPRLELGSALAALEPGWELAWTAHLEPVQLTPSLRLFPHRPAQPPGPGELYLEPAFAFGFGEHPSTRLAARWLEAACAAQPGCAVLDVGCGTGVLSLVALASGASRVLGLDSSPEAVAAARANLALNQRSGATFWSEPVARVEQRFERVVANIEAGVLHALAPALAARLLDGGELGLAGFIEEQVDALLQRYASVGVELELGAREEAWCLLRGRLAPPSRAHSQAPASSVANGPESVSGSAPPSTEASDSSRH